MNRYLKQKTVILLLWTSFSISYSQSTTNYFQETLYNDASHVLRIGNGFITAPFNFDHKDWQKTIYTVAATTALLFIDKNAKKYAQANQTKINNDIFKIDDYLRGTTGLYASAGLYSTGFLIQNNKIRTMGLHALETIFLAQSVTGFLKYSFGRARPYTGDDHLNFNAFQGNREKFRAFPSGHTTGAFAFASVMAMSVDNTYWKVFWYGSATMVGAARVYNNKHWLSDTFLAGVISYSIANYVVNYNSRRNPEDTGYDLSVYPFYTGLGIRLSF